ERAVTAKRATGVQPKLVLAQRRRRPGRIVEIVPRVEALVAEKLERAAMVRVGPRLGDDVDQRGRFAPKFSGIHRLLNLEFLNRLDRGAHDKVVEVFVGYFDA